MTESMDSEWYLILLLTLYNACVLPSDISGTESAW